MGLSSQLELVLRACTYKGDAVTASSDYVMAMSSEITTGYSFASDVVGFTMQIYQNSKSNDMVQCDVAIGFASDIENPVSQEPLAQDCPDTEGLQNAVLSATQTHGRPSPSMEV